MKRIVRELILLRPLRLAILGWVLLLVPCLQAAEVMVFAAVSLSESLREIGALYQTEKGGGDRVVFNFGASSLLARQIEEGAPADIFFSADDEKMDALANRQLLEPGTRKARLANSLVVVVFHDNPVRLESIQGLPGLGRIALAEPNSVPAGIYAKQHLVKHGLWQELQARIVPTENVRAALAAVESGNVDAGIVYKTDAAISRKVRVALEIPRDDGPRINYPVAMIRGSRQRDAAGRFLEFLHGDSAGDVFRKHGFIVRD